MKLKQKTKAKSYKTKCELLQLMNVGAATCRDFQLLGIKSIEELANASADNLYMKLQIITGQAQDPCVWDIFAAAINEARTGKKEPWWHWTKIRKKRQLAGTFCI
jgi:nucleotidyltransferase/DNA polymerase involved in DNA repair